jgi:hypothetical protein
VMLGYSLALARQRGLTMDSGPTAWDRVAEEALHDLVESKWSIYENPVSGAFSDGSTVRYLSIPKVDNEGIPFDHEALAITLDYIRNNPDEYEIDGKTISEYIDEETGTEFGEMFAKDALVFINSGDSNGINIALYDKANRGHLIILGDSIPWSDLNSKVLPDLFNAADEDHRSWYEKGWGLISQSLNVMSSHPDDQRFGGYFAQKERSLELYRKNVESLRVRADSDILKIKSYKYPDKEKDRLIKVIEDRLTKRTTKMKNKLQKRLDEEYKYQSDRINSPAHNVNDETKKSFSSYWKQIKDKFKKDNSDITLHLKKTIKKSKKSGKWAGN